MKNQWLFAGVTLAAVLMAGCSKSPTSPSVPSSPMLVSPANGASLQPIGPTLKWSASAGALSYTVQIASAAGFTTTILDQTGVTSTQTAISGLSGAVTYYWRTNAEDKTGAGIWSEVWSFTTSASFPTMLNIPAGTFRMGGSDSGGEVTDGLPVHTVTLSAFAMSRTLITQQQYLAVMDTNPSYYDSGSSWPVDQVNWFDAALFCNKLSKMAGLDTVYSYNGYAGFPVDTFGSVVIDYSRDGYRLPTEAEYEYAYRAGTTTDFYWGRNYPPETTGDTLAIDSNAIWFADDTINSTFPVALKKPNAFGLYDMAGDVFEWCNDWYAGYSSAAQTNPTGPAISTGERVQRGGLFGRFASGYAITYILCSWCRNSDNPADYQTTVGFRVVRGAH